MRIWIFAGILTTFILITFTNGKRSTYGKKTLGARITSADDSSSFTALDEPFARRKLFNLNYLFQRRESSEFTPSQRQFQNEMFEAHNQYRARHCVPLLTLHDDINRSCQNYAEYLATINQMIHSQTKGFGENLYQAWSSDPMETVSGTEATDVWYKEIQFYNFNNPGFSFDTGHFTQIVWKGSIKVGFGFALTSDGKTLFVVAQYSPPGNMMGEFEENVLPATC